MKVGKLNVVKYSKVYLKGLKVYFISYKWIFWCRVRRDINYGDYEN